MKFFLPCRIFPFFFSSFLFISLLNCKHEIDLKGGDCSGNICGTFHLPVNLNGKSCVIVIDTDNNPKGSFIQSESFSCPNATEFRYSIKAEAPGNYYVIGYVQNNPTLADLVNGDYLGFYAGSAQAAPASANVTVLADGSKNQGLDIYLFEIGNVDSILLPIQATCQLTHQCIEYRGNYSTNELSSSENDCESGSGFFSPVNNCASANKISTGFCQSKDPGNKEARQYYYTTNFTPASAETDCLSIPATWVNL